MKRLFSAQGSARTSKRRQFLLRLGFLYQLKAVSLLAIGSSLLGLTSAIALISIAPVVQAYTAEDVLTVSRVSGEDYTALARRAEYAARSAAQQRFDRDILLTRVVITVLGQNGGQTAPILVLDVNRNDWRRRPDPQYWAKYYRSTPVLLEMDGTVPVTQPAPPVASPTPESPNAPADNAPAGSTPPGSNNPANPADTNPPRRTETLSPVPGEGASGTQPGASPNAPASGTTSAPNPLPADRLNSQPVPGSTTQNSTPSSQPVPGSTIQNSTPNSLPPNRVNSQPVPSAPPPDIVPQTRVNSQPTNPTTPTAPSGVSP